MSTTDVAITPPDALSARNGQLLIALSTAVEAQGLRFDAWAASQSLQLQRILSELRDVNRTVDQKLDRSTSLAEPLLGAMSGASQVHLQTMPLPTAMSEPGIPQTEVQRPVDLVEPQLLAQVGNWDSATTRQSEDSTGERRTAGMIGGSILVSLNVDDDIGALSAAKGWMKSEYGQIKRTSVSRQPWLWQEWAAVANVLQANVFEYGVATLILANSVIIGVETDRELQNFGMLTAAGTSLSYLQDVCTVAFCLELLLRILAYRMLLFTRPDASWNVFDMFCVGVGMIELISTSLASQGSLVRTMRIPRVLRVLRVFRLSRFFREIRLMMYMIMCSFRSLFWMLMLLILLVYIVGVSLARFVITYMQDVSATDLESVGIQGIDIFMSVPICMLTLLKAAFGGDDWGQYLDVLQLVGFEATAIFLVYMACMLLAILNVITGVFVDHTMQSVREDHDLAISEELIDEESSVVNLKRLFRVVQEETNGEIHSNDVARDSMKFSDSVINEEDFYRIIRHEEVRAYFAVLGLDALHAEGLYKLLDMDSNGKVGLEEFVVGCLRLKGEAKAVDVATLMYENKRIMKRLNHMNHHHSHELRRFYEAIHHDLGLLGQRSQAAVKHERVDSVAGPVTLKHHSTMLAI